MSVRPSPKILFATEPIGLAVSLYNKVTGLLFVCLSVCLYRRISLTTEPKWFSFIGPLLIGPGMVYTILGDDI